MTNKPTPGSEPARPKPIVPLLDYQRRDVESNARFQWSCWSRQTGKSFTKSLRRIIRGLRRGRNQIFLSAGERQSRELMAKARQHCQALKITHEYNDNRTFKDLNIKQLEITLPGGVRIIGLPANPQTARGFTGDVFLDEFAMHSDDREIWAAMFPALLRGKGELDVASTPRGRNNVFYQLRQNPKFTHTTVTLPDAVAQGLNVNIDEIRQAMNDDLLFRQEFLCEFVDEAATFLTYDQIAACVDPNLVPYDSVETLAGETRELFVGIDIGRVRDLTILWVLARSEPTCATALKQSSANSNTATYPTAQEQWHTPLTTVAVFELSAAPFSQQFSLIAELLSLPKVRRCCIDAGGLGMQLAEQAQQRFGGARVEPIVFTAALKSQLAAKLRIAVEEKRIIIPADPRIGNDWHSVERQISGGGHFRLAAPRQEGSHADRFWAAALAVHAADAAAGRAESMNGRPLNFARSGIW